MASYSALHLAPSPRPPTPQPENFVITSKNLQKN